MKSPTHVSQSGGAAKTAAGCRMDWMLLGSVLVLAGLGLVMVLSASAPIGEKLYADKYHFFARQALYGGVGVLAMALCSRLPREVFYGLTYVWLGITLALLVLTLVGPLSLSANGASRWLKLGPFSLQPLELAKVALVFYLAYFFGTKQEKVKTFSIGFVPPLLVTLVFCVLLALQPDFGGAVFMALLLFLLSLTGGTRVVYLGSCGILAAAAAGFMIVKSPYRLQRLTAFMDPFQDSQNVGYQLVQSFYAFGSGGWLGEGLGAGKQKLLFLPEAHTDFLMAVVGEELGFIGVSIFFLLIGLILWRAFLVALKQDDLRDRFTAYGLTLILAVGFTLNLAVVLGAAPPKGVPMPFVSYGGTSMLASFICVGVLLNLSRRQS
jgi:cell division protein FtsW